MKVPKLHVLVPTLAFSDNFIISLKRLSARNLKNTLKLSKNVVFKKTTIFDIKKHSENAFSTEGFPASFLAKSAAQLI